MSRPRSCVVVVAAFAAVSGLLAIPARAVGPGTFTAITSPAADVRLSLAAAPATLTVAGTASPDVSTVDIACTVPMTCQRFGPRVCVGRIVVRSLRGKVLGQSTTFTVARGRGRTIAITLHGASGLARMNLHQREPSGTFVLAASRVLRI